jgi:hypothetical protein
VTPLTFEWTTGSVTIEGGSGTSQHNPAAVDDDLPKRIAPLHALQIPSLGSDEARHYFRCGVQSNLNKLRIPLPVLQMVERQ